MKKSDFIQLIKEPQASNLYNIEQLEQITLEFPFFSSAQLLLTKAFHQEENINFEAQLRKTAAFAGDRKRLHALLFDNTTQKQTTVASEIKEASVEDELSSKPNTELKTAVKEQQSNQENREVFPLKVVKKEEIRDQKADALDEQILTSAISSSILLEVDQLSEELETEQEEQKNLTTIEVKSENVETDEKVEDNFKESETHSFSSWMNHFGEPRVESMGSQKSLSEESKKVFLEISKDRPKQEFYSASKMAKLSVQENDDLMTETLANIYAQQGNLEKAISAYEILQLKYPEKSTYFAGRIKNLKDQLNS